MRKYQEHAAAYCVEPFDRNLFRSTLLRVATDEAFRKSLEAKPAQALISMGFRLQPEAIEYLEGKRLSEVTSVVDLGDARAVPAVEVGISVAVGVAVSVVTNTRASLVGADPRILPANTFAVLDEAVDKAEAIVARTALGPGL
jgi:hypothetical protein